MGKRIKGFNPFKMWGSYVGLVLGIIMGWFFFGQLIFIESFFTIGNSQFSYSRIIGVIIGIPTGFLIGYGIHSVVRATKRLM